MSFSCRFLSIPLILFLGGCVSAPYTLIGPGQWSVGNLQISLDATWNKQSKNPRLPPGGEMWTQDGLLLDRLIVLPDIGDGEPIFVSPRKDAVLPNFRVDMLPNEVEELVEASVVRLFGEGAVAADTGGLRPYRFGSQRGFFFDLNLVVSDGPGYRGLTGGFVANSKLYLAIFLGAEPYYWEKHLPRVEETIQSMRL